MSRVYSSIKSRNGCGRMIRDADGVQRETGTVWQPSGLLLIRDKRRDSAVVVLRDNWPSYLDGDRRRS